MIYIAGKSYPQNVIIKDIEHACRHCYSRQYKSPSVFFAFSEKQISRHDHCLKKRQQVKLNACKKYKCYRKQYLRRGLLQILCKQPKK